MRDPLAHGHVVGKHEQLCQELTSVCVAIPGTDVSLSNAPSGRPNGRRAADGQVVI